MHLDLLHRAFPRVRVQLHLFERTKWVNALYYLVSKDIATLHLMKFGDAEFLYVWYSHRSRRLS